MRKEINLEIELESLGSEIESFRIQKIEDPTLLPFKLLPFVHASLPSIILSLQISKQIP